VLILATVWSAEKPSLIMKRDGYKDRGTRLCNDKQMDLDPPLP